MKRLFLLLGRGLSAISIVMFSLPGGVQANPRSVNLFPDSVFRVSPDSETPPWAGREVTTSAVACETDIARMRFDRSGDTRSAVEREEFTSNADGSISAELFFTQMMVDNTRLDRASIDAMYAEACTPGDPGQNYRSYLRGPFHRAAAATALSRILDHEADKRKISPRVSRDRARYALNTFLVKMALERRYFGLQRTAVRRGVWTAPFLEGVNRVVDEQHRMTRLATDGEASGRSGCSREHAAPSPATALPAVEATPETSTGTANAPTGWAGWRFFYQAGIRPCPAAGAPARDYSFEEILDLPAPQVGAPKCEFVQRLSCPAGMPAAGRRGPFCGLTALELYAEMSRQAVAEAANASSVTPAEDRALALGATDSARPPVCRRSEAPAVDPLPMSSARAYDYPIEWSPFVLELEGETYLLEDDAHLAWSTVGNGANGVDIRVRDFSFPYAALVESIAEHVLQRDYAPLRRMAVWQQLVEQRFPDRAWQALFRTTRTSMERYYQAAMQGENYATCSRRLYQVYDLELQGRNAEGAATAILNALDAQIPTFNERLRNSTGPVDRGTGSECRVRTTEEIVSNRDAWFVSQCTTALGVARSIVGRGEFRAVRANAHERVVSAENSDDFMVTPQVAPATGYPPEVDSQLNIAPFFASMSEGGGATAFNRHVVRLPDGRVVIRLVLNGRTQVLEHAPMRLPTGRLNPVLFGEGDARRGIHPGPLRIAMESKTQAIQYRELAFQLFQQNRLHFDSRACSRANLECVWDARAMAEALFPEMEHFEPLGTTGSRGLPISSSLGHPELYDRVKTIETRAFMSALRVSNELEPLNVVLDEGTFTEE